MTVDVDLWLWRLEADDARFAELAAVLSDDEDGRARGFVRPEHGRAFKIARGRMRQILATYTGADPARFGFAYTPHRKPWLPGGPVFNLSHSGDWAALAVTPQVALGLDIEAPRRIERDVATRFFSPAEVAAMAALTGADWQAAFFRVWTRKEAMVKALGDGLSMPLDRFDVTVGPQAALLRLDHETEAAQDWTLLNLALGPGMAGALAVRTQGQPVRLTLREGQMPL